MALNLFYITNRPSVALLAEKYGVNRIWIDLETLGKQERQPGNTVKSQHSVFDISEIKPQLTTAELMVRVNPLNEDSRHEIDRVIHAGADLLMLPMWKSKSDVQQFLDLVDGRAKTSLLLETREAVDCIDDVLTLSFDEIHIGLNDLHLAYGMNFLFEPLASGMVDELCAKFRAKGIPYGFGGIARLGAGMLPSEKVIMEHYRLGSTRAILSRSFCNIDKCDNIGRVDYLFSHNMGILRDWEARCAQASAEEFEANRRDVQNTVQNIVKELQQ